ncbi:MAG: hypothetical protein JW993_11385 [Sedimentisphaerales bacterium]|nr:hypothetical protein [Sedimentisphaerales bacterium]
MLAVSSPALAWEEETEPAWKNTIALPEELFQSWTSPAYVKFTILRKQGYDPNVVYYQDSQRYEYHYDFALEQLEPFVGMIIEEFDRVTLHAAGQQAVLGAVILPPWHDPPLAEYGIQLVRHDAYSREEVVELLSLVQSTVQADPNVTAYYFPTYEQYPTAQQNRAWFADQGIRLGSTAQWTEGNAIYASGWALGTLKFIQGDAIQAAYTTGELTGSDILLTDGVPAEVPSVAGIISLMPATPNSHVAILARSQGVPFMHLAVTADAARAQELVGRKVYLAASDEDFGFGNPIKLIEAGNLSEQDSTALLALKASPPLVIEPMAECGRFWTDTNDLQPADIACFGGKAANFGVLRRALPDDAPRAMAFSFDLWNAFLDQPIAPAAPLVLAPGAHVLLWADGDPEQGPYHLDFKLSNGGESIGLVDHDGVTLLDALSFEAQRHDVSYGRSVDGGSPWQLFDNPTPGRANGSTSAAAGLVINEFMAWNKVTIQDPDEVYENPDWIELYNGSDQPVTLSGLFLTDDLDEPTKWQIPVAVTGPTLRKEIASRLSKHTTYPPADTKALVADLIAIRSLFTDVSITSFGSSLESVIIDALHAFGFDPNQPIRFRSSTNVEDSDQFTGAGLYESHSGRLLFASSIFDAIREVFASFYNDNAFLERLRHGVNESQVGMALLVHHSFPDEIELANGVATMERSHGSGWNVELVSQMGAISVTNPPTDAVPEIMRIESGPWGAMPWLEQRSSLVSLREDTVLASEDEYLRLYDLLVAAAEQYCLAKPKGDPVLDLEYKKVAPDGALVVKQIREIPQPGAAQYATPFLLGRPASFCTLQGRGSDVFTSHRLKSRWTLTPKSLWLDDENLHACVYADAQIEYVADGQVRQVSSQLSLLPGAEHVYQEPQWEFDQYTLIDSWRFDNLCNPRAYRLRTEPLYQATVSDPLVTFDSFRLGIEVDYAMQVPLGDAEPTTTEGAALYRPWEPGAEDFPEVCALDDPNTGVSLRTEFYMRWSWDPSSPTSIQFAQTRIEGLTTEPIVLTSFFSQSVGGGSHLCPKNFLFEPALEPGISAQTLAELKARNIRLIYYTTGARECRPTEWEDTPPLIRFYGFDDPIEGVPCDD